MIRIIYIVIVSYFILGGIGFYFINRKKSREEARHSWTKFGTYFVIIHILFLSIIFNPVYFRWLSIIILTAGLLEMIMLYGKKGFGKTRFFIVSVFLFGVLAAGLYVFSGMNKELILFVFLVLSIFDSFSQITGQLWGKRKLMPEISPNKTLEGLLGGSFIAVSSTFLLKNLTGLNTGSSILLAAGVVVFAFIGDLLASFYKRKYQAKDFSRMIPGHGGFLDRFDSLIAAGFWVALSFALALY